jgi:hypothetical protein
MMQDVIPCLCGVSGCTVGPHWQTIQHIPEAFLYAGEEIHEAPESVFRRAVHEAGHCAVARAVGALIEAPILNATRAGAAPRGCVFLR